MPTAHEMSNPTPGVTPIRFDAGRGVYQTEFHPEEHQPSTAVVEAVGAATGADPTALPCLADLLGVDAFDRLLGNPERRPTGPVTVRFTYCGFCMTVRTTGDIELEPLDDEL